MKVKQYLPYTFFVLGVITLLAPIIVYAGNSLSLWNTREPTDGGAPGQYTLEFTWNWNITNDGNNTITGYADPDDARFKKRTGWPHPTIFDGDPASDSSSISPGKSWVDHAKISTKQYLGVGNYYWQYDGWDISTNVGDSASLSSGSYPDINIY